MTAQFTKGSKVGHPTNFLPSHREWRPKEI
jgi:hypothetical protein